MWSLKYQSVLLACMVLSCSVLLPVVFGGHHHHNDDNGLAVLLAAGLLAKLLKHKHKHEEHHIHIPVPVHHEHHGHHEHHHGSGSARVPVHYPAPFQHLYGGAPMMGAHSYPVARHVPYPPPAAVAHHAPIPCPYKD